jgi:Domain of unknown function (DUF3291)
MTIAQDPARHHLAQFNIGTPRFPLDDHRMAGFMSQLASINALADAAPGFVWRLIAEGASDATSLRYPSLGDKIVNFSVWESREALWDYVYRSDHLDVLRQRTQWFELPAGDHLVLWWVPAGHIPTVDEAIERLDLLHRDGPSSAAFTFRHFFPTETLHRVTDAEGAHAR